MRTELIKTLLKAGIIDEESVAKAEEHPLGSGLAERLLDLGYGSEEDFYKVIKNKLNLAVVTSQELQDIDPSILSLMPKGIIERHHLLPFHSDAGSISVAMFDPTQDMCLNELCFFSHLRVIPYGALASDLTKALNKYFGLGLAEEFKHKKRPKGDGSKMDFTPPPPPNFPLPGQKPVTLPPLPSSKKAEIETPVSDGNIFDISQDNLEFRDISNTDIKMNFSVDTDIQSDEEKEAELQGQTIIDTNYIDLSLIEKANSKEDIINKTADALRTLSSGGLILFVKNDDLIAVAGVGENIATSYKDYKISLSAPNMFQWVFENKTEYVDAPQGGYINDMFFKNFGGFVPEKIAIIPAIIEDEVFAAVYTQDLTSLEEIKKVVSTMTKAFDTLLSAI